jgi:hypothetical protein
VEADNKKRGIKTQKNIEFFQVFVQMEKWFSLNRVIPGQQGASRISFPRDLTV